MFSGSSLRYFLLFVICLILLVANCGYSAPTKVVKFRQRPLLEMLNEHFHTFGRPRSGKMLHSSHDWMYSLPPQEVSDELWIENFEPFHGNPLLEPVSPEFFVDANDDGPLEARKSGLLRSLRLDYNLIESFDAGSIGAMSTHTPVCGGARRFEIKSELEKRLSQLNLEVLDLNHRQSSLHARKREHRPQHRLQAMKATSTEHASSGSDREVYKNNVMLIIGAANKYHTACKTDENYPLVFKDSLSGSKCVFKLHQIKLH
ncbi:hypothetical protein TSMEX_003175 [Taenia solium]|eukprot:TsM_000620000 transcript=TsM_000620000 gene=TsM_000620000